MLTLYMVHVKTMIRLYFTFCYNYPVVNKNKGKFLIGKTSDYEKGKGWFFGNFADNELLKSDLLEVASKNISNTHPSPADKHFHTSSVEINIVISGKISADINGKHFTIHKGEFYVIWPKTTIENVSAEEETQVIVIRSPSINDKHYVSKP